ncbi:hypothetical protein [Vibrio sp. Evd11]|uniref:hypothetical protein n=1 Tax=Vibrio sp. Evd11 TaxID=1207404 RepID=UPI000EFC82C2|nr:hypothetical protein [Vibrio sp. Evd11]
MLTKKGTQILDELASEQKADLEDRKNQFILSDLSNAVKGLVGLIPQFVSGFCLCFVALLGLLLMVLDAPTLQAMIDAPVNEVVAAKNDFLSFFAVSFLVMFMLYAVARKLDLHKSSEVDYQRQVNAYHKESTRQIELIEEVLHRHDLINKKEL